MEKLFMGSAPGKYMVKVRLKSLKDTYATVFKIVL